MNLSLFRCPVCSAPLAREAGSYLCPRGHRYDIAREGYVHLLPPNRKHSKAPGDDKDMVAARARFLSQGYYAPLLDTLEQAALRYADESPVLLDSGCGEGYYTAGVAAALRAGGEGVRAAGADLSKFALRRAARRDRDSEFAVASAYRLPVADGRVNLLLNCFSPMAQEEFRRVLSPGGVLLYVVPGPRHLWELKEILYNSPYPNPDETVLYGGFTHLEIYPLEFPLRLPCREDVEALFHMTPYTWKTPREGADRLRTLSELAVRAQFRVHIFRRDP